MRQLITDTLQVKEVAAQCMEVNRAATSRAHEGYFNPTTKTSWHPDLRLTSITPRNTFVSGEWSRNYNSLVASSHFLSCLT